MDNYANILSQCTNKIAMIEINNYQINDLSNEKALDKIVFSLAQKCFSKNLRTLIIVTSEMIEHFDQILWSYSKSEFLPHGTYKDSQPALQPILINDKLDNINKAEVLLIVCNETILEQYFNKNVELNIAIAEFSKILIIQESLFDNANADFIINNHIQKIDGGWEKTI